MFQLKTGSFRALEEALVTDVLQTRKDHPHSSLLIISPSGHMLTRLQFLLAKEGSAFLNIHFMTFYALAQHLLSHANYHEQVVTEPVLYQEAIRHILSGDHPEPVDVAIRQAFHNDNKPVSRGLTAALGATLKDLRDAGMRADKALEAAREGFLGPEAPEAAATLALYARLVGLFEKKELRSSADLLRRSAKEAPTHPWIQQQKGIFLYGFYDLTGVQLDLVLSLAHHPKSHIYFPYEEKDPAATYAESLLKDPAFLGKTNTIVDTKASGQEATATTHVWSCSGARDEVWLAAKEILKLADEGVAYHEIAVVSRNLSAYLPALREIFNAHEIPYTSSKGEPAGSHPLLKTVRTLFLLNSKHPREKTLQKDLGKSPYLHVPSENLLAIVSSEGEAASWSTHISKARQFLNDFIQLPEKAHPEELALHETILSTLQELHILDRLGEPVEWPYFLETWLSKLDELERPGVLKPHAGVEVLEVQKARGLSFRAVFLLGMNEKVFPRLIREDPFLSDAARAALAQATGCLLRRKLDGYNEERYLFSLMRSMATEHLHLTTQRSDEEGKARIPSTYLKNLEQEIPGLSTSRIARATAEKFESQSPLLATPKELSFLVNRAKFDPRPLYQALSWDIAGFERVFLTSQAQENFRTGLGPYDGVITTAGLVPNVHETLFSPTSLEQLAQCPFQYYADHVLHIPVEEDLAPEGEMTRQALGQLFHKTLEIFYEECRVDGFPEGPIALEEKVQRAVENCFSEFSARLDSVYPIALKATKRLVKKELLVFIKSDIEELSASGYRPRWFEETLSGALTPDVVPYLFKGKPDRLDIKDELGAAELRVVDYKSGKLKPSLGRIETLIIQGRYLQLPIYLGLAATWAKKNNGAQATAASATLRPVREVSEETAPKSLTTSFWQSPSALLFIENIKELIGIIDKKRFYIEPDSGDWGYCSRCDFARICRKEHMPSRLRAQRDPVRVRVFEKLARTAPTKALKHAH
jgi:RecB family exonuclease